MTLAIHWWHIAIMLILIPPFYSALRKSNDWWDMEVDTMLLAAVCWTAAFVLTLVKGF